MAGVKFDTHYSVTSVDPPELVRFIKEEYPAVKFERNYDENGKPITMWSLIPKRLMPPTRVVRYCCEELKESSGNYRYTVTGVRWEESVNRKNNHGFVTIASTSKRIRKKLEDAGQDYEDTKKGGLVLNYDNDDGREVIQRCVRTKKMLINPIVHWTTEDVWEFLNGEGLHHCCLYDEGFERIGCIGCPMRHGKMMEKDFERWPKYRQLYLKAFDRMVKEREKKGLPIGNFSTAQSVMDWWMST